MSADVYRNTYKQLLSVCAELSSRMARPGVDQAATFRGFLSGLVEALGSVGAALWLFDPVQNCLQIVTSAGLSDDYVRVGNRFAFVNRQTYERSAPVYHCFHNRVTHLSTGLADDQEKPFYTWANEMGFDAVLLAPLTDGESCYGTLALYQPRSDASTYDDVMSWLTLAAQQFSLSFNQLALRTQLQSSIAEITQASRYKDEFLSVISHELRTPLTIISGYAELIQDSPDARLDKNARRYLDSIVGAVQHLELLVDDLIDYAAMRAGNLRINLQSLNYSDCVRDICDQFAVLFTDKDIDFRCDVADESTVVAIDLARIRQVFFNILTNALKYTPAHRTVEVTVRVYQKVVRTEIRDEGIGIPAEDQKRIFDAFFRVDNSFTRETEGTGLGLSIASAIIQAHAGVLGVTSELDKGSIFFFELPVESPADRVRPDGSVQEVTEG